MIYSSCLILSFGAYRNKKASRSSSSSTALTPPSLKPLKIILRKNYRGSRLTPNIIQIAIHAMIFY